jgi:diacylglycerol kinase family enzyme
LSAPAAANGSAKVGTAVVLMNGASGGMAKEGEIREALAGAGVAGADIRIVEGRRLVAAASDAVSEGATVLIAAGGDGTVSAVASAVAGVEGVAMGVLPVGTLNHFAKDLGIPLDLAGAARVIAGGNVRVVDVGEVKGRVFVNNASIGIYPTMVRKRDEIRERLGRGKMSAMFAAGLSVFRRHPMVHLRIDVGDRCVDQRTPFVFVGNNNYEVSLLSLGRRAALDRGELCLYYTRRTGRWGLVWLSLRALFGRLAQDKDFEAVCLPEVYIESRRSKLLLAVDGEVVEVAPPLLFRTRPGGLRVLAPAASGVEVI